MDIQDINAFIKEESKKFEEADKIIAEVLPEVKQTSRDSRLIYAENDWSENQIKVPFFTLSDLILKILTKQTKILT